MNYYIYIYKLPSIYEVIDAAITQIPLLPILGFGIGVGVGIWVGLEIFSFIEDMKLRDAQKPANR